jgi:enamine deaminase RidA (YjgF/YER057c/UK114 family)
MATSSDRKPGPHRVLQPGGWPKPRGYANGIAARGTTIFVGGMVGWDERETFANGFVAQAKLALQNIVTVVRQAGGGPEHIVRLTWYVLDMDDYLTARSALGPDYRAVMGAHFPAMALVEVKRLVEPGALLEIEATAVVPD